jgi:hypothetical protein
MYDITFDRSFLQLSNSIRHVMPSTDPEPELTAKASMAQPVSQPAVYANGLINHACSASIILKYSTPWILILLNTLQLHKGSHDDGECNE